MEGERSAARDASSGRDVSDEASNEGRSGEVPRRGSDGDAPATTSASEHDVRETAPASDDGGSGASAMERPLKERPVTWLRVGRILLAPAMAALALGLHFGFNVPDEVHVSKRDQGAKRRAGRHGKGRKARSKDFEPRSDADLARLLRRYSRVDFDAEPVVARWARRHQALVNKAVIVARRKAFEGAPEDPRVIVSSTKCRTVRCRFLLRSPYAHELDLLDRALKRVRVGGDSLWRDYASERVDPPEGGPANDSYLQVTVAFKADEIEGSELEVQPVDTDEPEPAE